MVRYRKPTERSGDIIDVRGSGGRRRPGVAIGAGGGGLAIIIAIFRHQQTVNLQNINLLKG